MWDGNTIVSPVGQYELRRLHKGSREYRALLDGRPTSYTGTLEQLKKMIEGIIQAQEVK
jgi:hypothetical protein